MQTKQALRVQQLTGDPVTGTVELHVENPATGEKAVLDFSATNAWQLGAGLMTIAYRTGGVEVPLGVRAAEAKAALLLRLAAQLAPMEGEQTEPQECTECSVREATNAPTFNPACPRCLEAGAAAKGVA